MTSGNAIAAMLVLGLVAGLLSGMFGIGGGLVIVPTLIILYSFPAKTATGTSLFALIWPVGLLGVLEYWKRGEMRFAEGLWIAVGLFFGAYVGAKITGAISPSTMKRAYGVFLLAVGTYFLWTAGAAPGPKPRPVPAPLQQHPIAGDQVH